jgi:hypothetical protein
MMVDLDFFLRTEEADVAVRDYFTDSVIIVRLTFVGDIQR